MPRKNRKDPNQKEFDFEGGIQTKKVHPNGKGKKRRFPIEKIKKRLIKLKIARAKRLAAEEVAKEYQAVIKDLQHRLGKVNSRNSRSYIRKLEEEQKKEEALARSYARTGTDTDMVETHEKTADHIHRYTDTLKRHFKIK